MLARWHVAHPQNCSYDQERTESLQLKLYRPTCYKQPTIQIHHRTSSSSFGRLIITLSHSRFAFLWTLFRPRFIILSKRDIYVVLTSCIFCKWIFSFLRFMSSSLKSIGIWSPSTIAIGRFNQDCFVWFVQVNVRCGCKHTSVIDRTRIISR